MASKSKSMFICNECGFESPRWLGKCPSCNAWNSLEETVVTTSKTAQSAAYTPSAVALPLSMISLSDEARIKTKISELDRVLGGGIVEGSVTLLSGDPGIGKSTILLQICNALQNDKKILYIAGEESAAQIKLRAGRLGVNSDNISILCETNTLAVCDYINQNKPDLVMVDSIQTMTIPEISSASGSIVQVRESTNFLLKTAKSLSIPTFIVGHVNKGGDIAGPKVMEHIVDTVLYFEGERNQSYRILRSIKNRFGSTNEIGVFEMTEAGLIEVENPSAMLLSGRTSDVSGDCITCVIEGTRPILAEVQALTTPSGFGNARRNSTGFDFGRLNLLLAVLEKRLGLNVSNFDAYVNIVGGMHLEEPAADLAVALSLVSAIKDQPIDENCVAFGEIGLSGEVRAVPRSETRINEAARLGFTKCILPKASLKKITTCPDSLELIGVSTLKQAIAVICKG